MKYCAQGLVFSQLVPKASLTLRPNLNPNPNPYYNPCHNLNPNTTSKPNLNRNEF